VAARLFALLAEFAPLALALLAAVTVRQAGAGVPGETLHLGTL
jgi:hypothetical protein